MAAERRTASFHRCNLLKLKEPENLILPFRALDNAVDSLDQRLVCHPE
ncbi:MAG: hypothetical protein JAY75_07750 [Candidatus Thiodiazotropha taylori]|nr:hypothetical protein [Candidatus Thiodiazotropha taylori]MCW4225838.1 hypothetical protein [Candidatus Thiodiazotropha endolucinida]MCG7880025.1 hypothetical protein [Candidatus Thiodiazotropha taylori]MCG7887406.1 hypothetical protein [Candidatus Thiodiazotropha taylori]MCG7891397.1 hypothetical protein [Candidatus Thiodiazotropha taylori]